MLDDESELKEDKRVKLDEIMNQEETLRRQKSRVHWLKQGESNTAYVHMIAYSTNMVNYISSL